MKEGTNEEGDKEGGTNLLQPLRGPNRAKQHGEGLCKDSIVGKERRNNAGWMELKAGLINYVRNPRPRSSSSGWKDRTRRESSVTARRSKRIFEILGIQQSAYSRIFLYSATKLASGWKKNQATLSRHLRTCRSNVVRIIASSITESK